MHFLKKKFTYLFKRQHYREKRREREGEVEREREKREEEKERERENMCVHLSLVHSSNGCKAHNWPIPKPGVRSEELLPCFHIRMGSKHLECLLGRSQAPMSGSWLISGTHMRCRSDRQWFYLLCHNLSPNIF